MGFGDFNPKTNSERLFIAAAMVFGVSIFSYILGEIVEMFGDFKKIFLINFHQDEELQMFFGVLTRFNDHQTDHELVQAFEKFFHNKWHQDKNLALVDGSLF